MHHKVIGQLEFFSPPVSAPGSPAPFFACIISKAASVTCVKCPTFTLFFKKNKCIIEVHLKWRLTLHSHYRAEQCASMWFGTQLKFPPRVISARFSSTLSHLDFSNSQLIPLIVLQKYCNHQVRSEQHFEQLNVRNPFFYNFRGRVSKNKSLYDR